MNLSDFNYHLPLNLIAQKPASPRDHCRLLILNRKTGDIKHKKFFEIEKYLQKGDVLVLNDSKVIPARLYGHKIKYHQIYDRTINDILKVGGENIQNILGGKTEILLIKKISTDTWEAMLKNFKEKGLGKKILISHPESANRQANDFQDSSSFRSQNDNKRISQNNRNHFIATPIKIIGEGLWQIKFNLKNAVLDKTINKYGQTPLPPYIKSSVKLADYQTIYARKEGSVAAPTAGLHFTKRLINKLKKKGVMFEKITLHVGLGTFAPIREENIEKHKMHSEYAEISAKTAKAINKAKVEGRRVIAVGTTSARTLEAFASLTKNYPPIHQPADELKNKKYHQCYDRRINDIFLKNDKNNVALFIKPGYKFKIIDGMITNFHLPETTLMILVSAFAWRGPSTYSGRDKILRAYNEAIKKKYRFFSFGDAMLII